MLSRLGNLGDTFPVINNAIHEWIADGKVPEKLSTGAFRLVGQNISYYWFQSGDDITIGVELEKRSQGYAISVVGKNPAYSGQPPYATDLYLAILPTVPHSLLFSDGQLTDDGIELWKRLISDRSNVVSVYNHKDLGKSFKTLSGTDDLEDYLGPDHYYDRFVLSKKGHTLAETRSYFNIRRYRELSGLSLTD
jgi:hypothetical protein